MLGFKSKKNDLRILFDVGGPYCKIETVFGRNVSSTVKEKIILAESAILLIQYISEVSGSNISDLIIKRLKKLTSGGRFELPTALDIVEKSIYEALNEEEKHNLKKYVNSNGSLPIYLADQNLKNFTRATFTMSNNGEPQWQSKLVLSKVNELFVFPRLPILYLGYLDKHLNSNEFETICARITAEI
jgi:hypothetical protein